MTTPPPFEFELDAARRQLRWTIRGFWTLADVAAFDAAMRAALVPLGPSPQRYDGLCDARDFPVQSIEVSNALGAVEAAAMKTRNGRVGVVVGSAMNKLQAERTLVSAGVGIFRTMEEAKAWIVNG